MRDIRNDLAERARLIEDQISAAYAQFEKMLEQLQNERDGKVSDLKSEFAALGKLMEVENRRMANVLPLAVQGPAPQLSLADFIMQTLNEIGPMAKDDIVDLASKEGYFSDAENADRSVHGALVSLHRNEHIRQLQEPSRPPRWRRPSGSGGRCKLQIELGRRRPRNSSDTSRRTFSSA